MLHNLMLFLDNNKNNNNKLKLLFNKHKKCLEDIAKKIGF